MQADRTLKILILEDNPDDVFMIERTLKKDEIAFVAQVVDTRDEFTNAIRSFEPDLVLSDHSLPQFNSIEALKICTKERHGIPFILVTGSMSDEFAIKCLQGGADDYILKSSLTRLPSAIRRALKGRRLEQLKREARRALRKQNAELLKVNHELDSFVYSVSHNLRSPLASVLGLLQIAEYEERNESLAGIHGRMRQSVVKLDETLKEIIEFSRNANNELLSEPIDWSSIIDAAYLKSQYIDNPCNIVLATDIHNREPFFSDPARLSLVFNSLFSNAIRFHDKQKKPAVHVRVQVGGGRASIEVEDNGIGIADEVLGKVFDMFYRGTEMSQGAGLGLYIARETVSRMKGTIELSSIPGSGTIARVMVPDLRNLAD